MHYRAFYSLPSAMKLRNSTHLQVEIQNRFLNKSSFKQAPCAVMGILLAWSTFDCMDKSRFLVLKPGSSKLFRDLFLRNRASPVLAVPVQVISCTSVTVRTQVCSEIANLKRFRNWELTFSQAKPTANTENQPSSNFCRVGLWHAHISVSICPKHAC